MIGVQIYSRVVIGSKIHPRVVIGVEIHSSAVIGSKIYSRVVIGVEAFGVGVGPVWIKCYEIEERGITLLNVSLDVVLSVYWCL